MLKINHIPALCMAAVLTGVCAFAGCGSSSSATSSQTSAASETTSSASSASTDSKTVSSVSSEDSSSISTVSASSAKTESVTPSSNASSASSASSFDSTQLPNPWTETSSLEEAEAGSGVSFTPPAEEALSGYEGLTLKTYLYMNGTIEASYSNGTDTLTVRKSNDCEGQTLSGDYNEYSSSWEYSMKGLAVACRGDGSSINEATFSVDSDHFAVSCNPGEEGKGITEEAMTSLIMGMS